MGIIKLDESNFNAEIKEYAGVALIDFYADWCGPCKMVSPIVDEIAEEYNNYKICKVNVDEAPRLAEQFSVMSIPTLVVMKNGEIADTHIGLASVSYTHLTLPTTERV